MLRWGQGGDILIKKPHDHLKELRGVFKTQEQFAKELGVSTSLYAKYERGEREISVSFLRTLKRAFPTLDINVFFD